MTTCMLPSVVATAIPCEYQTAFMADEPPLQHDFRRLRGDSLFICH